MQCICVCDRQTADSPLCGMLGPQRPGYAACSDGPQRPLRGMLGPQRPLRGMCLTTGEPLRGIRYRLTPESGRFSRVGLQAERFASFVRPIPMGLVLYNGSNSAKKNSGLMRSTLRAMRSLRVLSNM